MDTTLATGILAGLHGLNLGHWHLGGPPWTQPWPLWSRWASTDTTLATGISAGLHGLNPTQRALTLKFLPSQSYFRALFLPSTGTSVSKSASKPAGGGKKGTNGRGQVVGGVPGPARNPHAGGGAHLTVVGEVQAAHGADPPPAVPAAPGPPASGAGKMAAGRGGGRSSPPPGEAPPPLRPRPSPPHLTATQVQVEVAQVGVGGQALEERPGEGGVMGGNGRGLPTRPRLFLLIRCGAPPQGGWDLPEGVRGHPHPGQADVGRGEGAAEELP